MHLYLQRGFFTKETTCGLLVADNILQCLTLEDQVRIGSKVKGETAIPYGTYEIILSHSPKYNRVMPLITGVPGFDGIRIHSGVKDEHTEGCLLVGETIVIAGNDLELRDSKTAYDKLFIKLNAAWTKKEKITIDISKEL